jgi:putative oxidoreductase
MITQDSYPDAADQIAATSTRYGITLLRLALGVMFLAHSVVLKLLTYGLAGTAQFFMSVGLPAWLAYLTFGAEFLGGLLLLFGIQTRWVALALSPFLLGALAVVHWHNGWVFTAPNGGWEYPAYLFVLCVAQALLGDGALAMAPSRLPTAFSHQPLVQR